MANENVSPELLATFEKELVEYAIRTTVVQPSNGHSFAFGYLISMLGSGMFNKDVIEQRLTAFKE